MDRRYVGLSSVKTFMHKWQKFFLQDASFLSKQVDSTKYHGQLLIFIYWKIILFNSINFFLLFWYVMLDLFSSSIESALSKYQFKINRKLNISSSFLFCLFFIEKNSLGCMRRISLQIICIVNITACKYTWWNLNDDLVFCVGIWWWCDLICREIIWRDKKNVGKLFLGILCYFMILWFLFYGYILQPPWTWCNGSL